MTDPYEERKIMKRNKEYVNMVGYVVDAEYGIPTKCLCGGRIINEVAGSEVFDSLPGKRFFTCSQYKGDGLHFRQPWVCGVDEEIHKLTKRVKEAERAIWEVQDLTRENKKLKEEVDKLTLRLGELEMYL